MLTSRLKQISAVTYLCGTLNRDIGDSNSKTST